MTWAKPGAARAGDIREMLFAFRIAAVFFTACALGQARLAALEAGCSDFVAKPVRCLELFAVFSKHLGVDETFTDAA
jgi:CheY-like chemotaxis protein